jgi:ligand-binding sensor domain-containing protein
MYTKAAWSALTILAVLFTCPLFAADKWQNFNVEKTPGLAGNEIQFIELMGNDVWVGTLSGLSLYRAGKFTTVTMDKTKRVRQGGKMVEVTEEIPAKFQAWDVLDMGGGSYLVGTQAGVYPLKNGKVGEVALKEFTVSPVFRFGGAEVWALCKNRGTEQNSLYHLVKGEWQPIKEFANKRIADVSLTPDGHVWVIIDGDGVLEIDPKTGIAKAEHHLQGLNVTTVFRTGKGHVWCGTWGRGVFAKRDGEWISYLGKLKSAVLDIDEGKDGTIWVATTADGLWRYDGDDWSGQLAGEGPINLLFVDKEGKVWVSSQIRGGLRYLSGDQWVASLATPLPMRCLATDRRGKLWAGGVLDGLHVKGGL